ncbi:MAG: hypothetical protein WC665_02915 [Sulfurimonas sp.]|jgi:hypothetical protein
MITIPIDAKSSKLFRTNSVLSELDSNYKRLWDFNNSKAKIA